MAGNALRIELTMQNATNTHNLIRTIAQRLNGNGVAESWNNGGRSDGIKGSAVLFLLTLYKSEADGENEPCLLLNKRSEKVLQPGDLCCPGGGVEKKDRWFSHLLQWPSSPLRKWPAWRKWRAANPEKIAKLTMLLTTALREGWEEMRLNPWTVSFLGPLPVQQLIMFRRHIYPLVGWVPPDQRLVPNWEVERIVHIPLSRLLDPSNYARYRLTFHSNGIETRRREDFPCFIHRAHDGEEILWGATLRITLDFLNIIYGFELPDLSLAPVIPRRLGDTYLNGSLAGTNTPEDPEDY